MLVLTTFPVLAARASAFLSYDRRHIAERYGIFTLIALVESAASGDRPGLDERLTLAVGLAAQLVAMALIRWATRRFDRFVALRLLTTAVLVSLALGAGGASAVLAIAASTLLVVAESLVETAWRPTPVEESSRIVLPHELRRSRGPRGQ